MKKIIGLVIALVLVSSFAWIDHSSLESKYGSLLNKNETLATQRREMWVELTELKESYKSCAERWCELSIEHRSLLDEHAILKAQPWGREFNSWRELERWLSANGISERAETSFYEREHFARALVKDAREDGYCIGLLLLVSATSGDESLCNFAFIGNKVYLIDPLTDYLSKVDVL